MDFQTDSAGNDSLAAVLAGIVGLASCDDVGYPDANLMPLQAPKFVICDSIDRVMVAAEAGHVGIIDTAPATLSVCRLSDGTYYCSSPEWNDWIASSIAAARAWLRAGVGAGVITASPAKTVC